VRVAAAAIAKKWLHEKYGLLIRGYLSQLGSHELPFKDWETVGTNPFFSADPDIVPMLEAFMDELRKAGDSIGARITTVAEHVPVGWGAPVYGKLDADLAAAMMSINAVKAVEIGSGFASVAQRGSEHGDELTPDGFVTNNAGGILGGISTGQDIVVTIGIKPTSSIRIPRKSIDKQGNPVMVETNGRHDPCVGIRATPIAEAMMALVLMDHALLHRAQNADVATKTPKISGRLERTPATGGQKPL
jgi:chorismate synthase